MMKMKLKKYIRSGWLLLSALTLVFMTSCKEDEGDTDTVEKPIASFQFEVSETNFLEVTFSNFSQNATSYSWDFGDGKSSTEENPTHTYVAAGDYEVVLTASNGTEEVEKEQTVSLTDPNSQLTALAGMESKTWILQRQGVTLGIGPAAGATGWWSFGGVTPHADRPCILDDEYTFTREGAFQFESNGTIFLDGTGDNGGWNDTNPDVCNDEASADWISANGNDMSAFQNGGDYTYEFDEGILTLSGDGVYIGLPNKNNNGNLGSESDPQSTMVYSVIKLVDNEDVDSLHLALKVNDEEVYWSFFLVHYDDESLKPEIPTESEPFGEDLPDETPTALFNTFASTDAADVDGLVPTESAVTLTVGVDDPADASASKVGQYDRGTAEAYADLKFQLDYDVQLTNFSTVSIEVYFPSTNDYSGALSQQVDIFLADASQTQSFWESWELYVDAETTVTDEWVTFTFDLGAALDRSDIDLIGLKIGGENHNEDGTFYIRNFKFE